MDKRTYKYLSRLTGVLLAVIVLVGIPKYLGEGLILLSWIPALIILLFFHGDSK